MKTCFRFGSLKAGAKDHESTIERVNLKINNYMITYI